ncbi:MAG: RluA family pseudouridine synthase [Candidatus Gastranaerophilales bacterium]|nr:RluA family pseudouridine synthase [Candidatus Gastranaerophilales bacterium]
MTNHIFIADETDANTRIDSYLSGLFVELSRTKIQEFIKSEKVLVNDKSCKPSQVIHTDDKIYCDFSAADVYRIEPENIPIEIIYEDENIAIVNKPSGMLTHPDSKEKNNTLVNALLAVFGDNLSDLNGGLRRGIVHRLDRNTSGLLIIAKTNYAHSEIARMIKNRVIEKHYRTIVKGVIPQNLVINEPIGRNKAHPNKMCVTPEGKPAVTEISVIEQFDDAAYLDINLITGRTHQIRVHLSYINHPVYNDTLYGSGKMKIKTDEQVLQSYKLKFISPFDGKLIDIEIEPDEKIKKVLNYLRAKNTKE